MPIMPPTEGEPFDLMAAAEPPHLRLPAWLLSCLLHATVMIVLALLVRDTARGVAPEPDRSAGIVLTQTAGQRTQFFSEADQETVAEQPAASATDAADASASAAAALPSASQLPVDLAGILPDSGSNAGIGSGTDLTAALPSAGQLASGPAPSRSLGKGNKTYLFGLEGEGSLFVYVFDRSDSMNGYEGRPLAAAKTELINSIAMLEATQQFQVIFYNHEVTVFNPNPGQTARLMFADDTTKDLAERFIRALPAAGSTEHMAALLRALLLAPDVIFFLTDAADPQLTAQQLERIRRSNKGTVIHTIEFGPGPFPGGDNFLMRLARQNNGRHTYVDVTRLPKR
jgi:hypothetical protein